MLFMHAIHRHEYSDLGEFVTILGLQVALHVSHELV